MLGWQTDSPCVPARDGPTECPVADPQWRATIPPSHGLFGLPKPKVGKLEPATTPLRAAVTVVANLPIFAEAARHAGYFNAFLDADGVVRTAPLVMAVAGKLHPSLALAMAQVVVEALSAAEATAYAAAHQAYVDGAFAAAVAAFEARAATSPHKIYPLMAERSRLLASRPQAPGWSGAWTMVSK
ncbi:MAG: CHASE2 domain-containing protein [Myxococcales bacterium]|nr:CHASE2 domain-containing protein [Myxococcales bacterium]